MKTKSNSNDPIREANRRGREEAFRPSRDYCRRVCTKAATSVSEKFLYCPSRKPK